MTRMIGQPKPPLDELAHYGVKGMKWGVRKDETVGKTPPTHLEVNPKESLVTQQVKRDYNSMSNDEFVRKYVVSKRRYAKRVDKYGDPYMHVMSKRIGSDDAAPLIALGAVYAGLILAATISRTKDSGKFHQIKTQNTPWKLDPSLAKKMSVDDLHKKVVAPINSNYGAKGTKMNCRRCTFTYEMRRRGFDVKATTSNYATGQTQKGINKATAKSITKNESIWGEKRIASPATFTSIKKGEASEVIFSTLRKQPNGARGEICFGWAMGGGHSMAWEIVNGKPVVFDTQNGNVYRKSSDHKGLLAYDVYDATYTRLDNKPLDESFMRKWATNNG